jgi:hypothetical protein
VEGDRFIIKNSIFQVVRTPFIQQPITADNILKTAISKERLILFSDRQPLFLKTVPLKV